MFKMKFKFSNLVKITVLVSPSQQNGWLLLVQHTFCVTDKVNRHLSKKMKKKKKKKKTEENEEKKPESVKCLRYVDEFFSRIELLTT